jgi:hypothetical protein
MRSRSAAGLALCLVAGASCQAPRPAPAREPVASHALTPAERAFLRQRADEESARWQRERAEREAEAFDPGELAEHTRRITQRQIDSGAIPLAAVFQQGESFFDRELGVREGLGTGLAGRPPPGLARVESPLGRHGGDAMSCRECHHRGGDDGHGEAQQRAFLLGDGHRTSTAIARVPPHLAGLGLIQVLAAEMTGELQRLRDGILAAARAQRQRQRLALSAMGVSFGSIAVDPDGRVDTTDLRGVDPDLVVRPFGWRGEHATLRAFVTQAVEQHLGLDATPIRGAETFATSLPPLPPRDSQVVDARAAAVPDDVPAALAAEEYRLSRLDADRDGVADEVTLGQVTSLAVYLALLDTPVILPPTDPALHDLWSTGFSTFQQLGCGGCHRSELVLSARGWTERAAGHPRGVTFDVVRDAQVHPGPDDSAYDQGGLVVRLFSDLRRHDMGEALAERPSGPIGAREFLTRPLWGIGDRGPCYLHDGRARSLDEAVLLHGGEAASSARAYDALPLPARRSVQLFLASLRRMPQARIVP